MGRQEGDLVRRRLGRRLRRGLRIRVKEAAGGDRLRLRLRLRRRRRLRHRIGGSRKVTG